MICLTLHTHLVPRSPPPPIKGLCSTLSQISLLLMYILFWSILNFHFGFLLTPLIRGCCCCIIQTIFLCRFIHTFTNSFPLLLYYISDPIYKVYFPCLPSICEISFRDSLLVMNLSGQCAGVCCFSLDPWWPPLFW